MGLYLKTRLFEEPFMIQKALTQANRIQKWIGAQSKLFYNETEGFYCDDIKGVFFKPSGPVTEKTIPCSLTFEDASNTVNPIVITFDLFYMKSHSQSLRYTDVHVFIENLGPRQEEANKLLTRLLDTLRQHFNGNWVITDQELHSSRLL